MAMPWACAAMPAAALTREAADAVAAAAAAEAGAEAGAGRGVEGAPWCARRLEEEVRGEEKAEGGSLQA